MNHENAGAPTPHQERVRRESPSRLVIDPRVALHGMSPDDMAETYGDSRLFEQMKQSLEDTPCIELRTTIDGVSYDPDASEMTVVGPPRSGKTAVMEVAAKRLHLPIVDAGLIFRALAAEAQQRGYDGGDISPDLES